MRNRIGVLVLVILVVGVVNGTPKSAPESSTRRFYPGRTWDVVSSPESAGFRSTALHALRDKLTTLPTTSMMVVVGGRQVFEYGDLAQVSYLASARKSILSMLYGKYVERGVIDL